MTLFVFSFVGKKTTHFCLKISTAVYLATHDKRIFDTDLLLCRHKTIRAAAEILLQFAEPFVQLRKCFCNLQNLSCSCRNTFAICKTSRAAAEILLQFAKPLVQLRKCFCQVTKPFMQLRKYFCEYTKSVMQEQIYILFVRICNPSQSEFTTCHRQTRVEILAPAGLYISQKHLLITLGNTIIK